MKKILILILSFLSLKAAAQNGDSLRDKLNSIFQNVDKSQIPTGYLIEYGTEFTPLHWYNGILSDSNLVFSLFPSNVSRRGHCVSITNNPRHRLLPHLSK